MVHRASCSPGGRRCTQSQGVRFVELAIRSNFVSSGKKYLRGVDGLRIQAVGKGGSIPLVNTWHMQFVAYLTFNVCINEPQH